MGGTVVVYETEHPPPLVPIVGNAGEQAAQGPETSPEPHRTNESEEETVRNRGELATVDTRGGGIGRRLRRLFGLRSPSPTSDDIGSSDTPSDLRESRRRHLPRDPGHHQRRRHRRRSSGSSSESADSRRRRRRRLSEPHSRHRSSRHPQSSSVERSRRDLRGNNARFENRNPRRRASEGGTTRHTRGAGHRASHHGTGRTESIRFLRDRGRHTRHAEAVQDSLGSRPHTRPRRSRMPHTSPRQSRDTSPVPLSVAAPGQRAGPPNYDEMSEDELFSVILAEERAMDPFLVDMDARRTRGEDV